MIRTPADRTPAERVRERAVRAAVQGALALGSEGALCLLSLALAEEAGWLPEGSCAGWAGQELPALERALAAPRGAAASLRRRSGGRLPLGRIPVLAALPATRGAARELLSLPALDRESAAAAAPDALSVAYESLAARAQGRARRKQSGLYYTPPELAAQVVALALEHGPALPARPRVLDCCAGAGLFLLAAARALGSLQPDFPHALSCAGSDVDLRALEVTGAVLALLAGPGAPARALAALQLDALDALQTSPRAAPVDLLITNPPYGHLLDERARAAVSQRYPALRGGEIDLYAAFLLRSLELVRPGGCAVLLVPDTWMTNARSSALRAAVLDAAELRAIADFGKPFAAAKDTRVQAVVMVRRRPHRERATRGARPAHEGDPGAQVARLDASGLLVPLSPISHLELRAGARRGWQPYRSRADRRLVEAMERASVPLERHCTVGYGMRTGDNGRHVARGERPAGALALCGGEDIVPFALRLRPKWLREPTTELERLAKKQLATPRIAVQRIRTNAAAPWARWLEAALAPPGLICLDSLSTLSPHDDAPPELAWALLGLLSSVAWNRYHRLRTTDVNVKPSLLRTLPLPLRLRDPSQCRRLAQLAVQRAGEVERSLLGRDASARGQVRRKPEDDAPALERAINRAVYALFELDEELIAAVERDFWGERFGREHARLPPGDQEQRSSSRDPSNRLLDPAGPWPDPRDLPPSRADVGPPR